jgi:membrane-bound lytic murein transglycosylase B
MNRLKALIRFAVFCILFLSPSAYANEKPLGLWVQEFKSEAMAQGISEALLEETFQNFTPNPRIIELDRKQPEGTVTFTKYLSNVVTSQRIKEGQRLYIENKALLEEIGKKYGVQPRFIVALWGIETSYGKVTGNFNVPQALATLAYDGRRSDFFRGELLKSLQIIEAGHIHFHQMLGSWAGAMGQSQFMPSSFLNFAVDYNGDGRKDIWNTKADIFASIANYLKTNGWNADLTWGRPVKLPAGFKEALADIKAFRPLSEWRKMGVTQMDGTPLPDRPIKAAVMFPGKPEEGAYVIYENYPVILHWNRSRYFATAVGTLADMIYGQ